MTSFSSLASVYPAYYWPAYT